MTGATERLRAALGLGDPFGEPPFERLEEDLQGWAGTDPLLHRAVEITRPGLVIEVGTWKGQSAVFMAEACRALGLDAAVLCIDTWLGSLEHLLDDRFRPLLGIRRGRPTLFEQFLANVRARGLEGWITPLPQTSIIAARFLWHRGVRANLVYLDASHEEADVQADLEAYWPLLRPGGTPDRRRLHHGVPGRRPRLRGVRPAPRVGARRTRGEVRPPEADRGP